MLTARQTGYLENGDRRPGSAPILLAAVAVVIIAGAVVLQHAAPLSRHMAMHILAMNAVAPLLALAALAYRPAWRVALSGGLVLSLVSALQIFTLWLAHAPAWIAFSLPWSPAHGASQLVLFAAALLFWLGIFSQRGTGRAQALLALLITGKMFCLLGALLVFSPRSVYAADIWEICAPGTTAAQRFADQQFAGLLMLTACPLSYVLAGITIAALWLRELDRGSNRRVA